ncbi:SMI1/KNR4 family protein [Delftia sp. WSY_4]|jgi:hypothetical protein|uniref:SMI1/KNR4 family protein n=1 Tax=Delftia TaxID=80865 RepID=UPI000A53162F|nr:MULTISPECIES: SMI1/KNR4 family protein [Delftia]MDC2862996.1 SMI1/KNR4 family protein [Delftia sp. DT-2]BDE71674.1 hypothetical protein HQS1_27980 [Delftia lacustris]
MNDIIESIKNRVLNQYDRDPPLEERNINDISKILNLPANYVEWMRWANGGEGQFGSLYLSFWPIDELEILNNDFLVKKYLGDKALCFATNGGGVGYIFKHLPNDSSVWAVPLGDLDWASAKKIGDDFLDALLNALNRSVTED